MKKKLFLLTITIIGGGALATTVYADSINGNNMQNRDTNMYSNVENNVDNQKNQFRNNRMMERHSMNYNSCCDNY